MYRMMWTRMLLVGLGASLVATVSVEAADSPQFRGPTRDGVFQDTDLLNVWPEGGPPLAWTAEGVGKGYSSVSVVGDTIYLPGMLDDNVGYIFALDIAGKEKWRAAFISVLA